MSDYLPIRNWVGNNCGDSHSLLDFLTLFEIGNIIELKSELIICRIENQLHVS